MSENNEEIQEKTTTDSAPPAEEKAPAKKRSKKRNIRRVLAISLSGLFVVASVAAIAYIMDDASQLSETGKGKVSAKPGMLSPNFVPNSVKYPSKENVRIYIPPEPKKNAMQSRGDKDKEADAKSLANKNPDGTSALLPPFLKSTRNCEPVTQPRINSLTKNDAAIQNLSVPAYWKAFNNTDENIAIVISQDGNDIAVVFLPPKARFETRIPATELSFAIRHTKQPCIEWNGGHSAYSKMPVMKASDGGDQSNLYRNAVFETAAFKGIAQIEGQTKLLGYVQE